MMMLIILCVYIFFRFGIAEVDTCSDCNGYFVRTTGDNMTGQLWLPNFQVWNANSEENSTLVGDGTDYWKVGVWDGGYGLGKTINLRGTQSATISFGNMTETEPKLVFAPANLTAYQKPQYYFTAFNESGTDEGTILALLGDKTQLTWTWWMIRAKKYLTFVDADAQIEHMIGFLNSIKYRYVADDFEVIAECSPAGLFCGSNPTRELSFKPQGDLLLKPNSTFTISTGHIVPSLNITYDLGSPSLAWRSLYVQTVYEGSAGAVSATVDDFMDLDLKNKDVDLLKDSFPEEIKDTYLVREYNQKIAYKDAYEEEVAWNYVPKPGEQIRIERRKVIVPDSYVSKAVPAENETLTEETFLDVFSELRWTQTVLKQVMTETCLRDHTYSWCS